MAQAKASMGTKTGAPSVKAELENDAHAELGVRMLGVRVQSITQEV